MDIDEIEFFYLLCTLSSKIYHRTKIGNLIVTAFNRGIKIFSASTCIIIFKNASDDYGQAKSLFNKRPGNAKEKIHEKIQRIGHWKCCC